MDVFNDVSDYTVPTAENTIYGQEVFDNLYSLSIGVGAKAFKADESGIWLGANRFEDAPFSVDMSGNITASTLNLSAYLSKTGENQPLSGSIIIRDASNNVSIFIGDGDLIASL